MKYKSKVKDKYVGQGFVEALIAVGIAGIAGIVLLKVSVRSIKQTTMNEIEDQKTQNTVNQEVLVDYLVGYHNDGYYPENEGPISALKENSYQCFDAGIQLGDPDNYDINPLCGYSMEDGVLDRECDLGESNEVFTVICTRSSVSSSTLRIDYVSGLVGCDGDGCSDYVNSSVYTIR